MAPSRQEILVPEAAVLPAMADPRVQDQTVEETSEDREAATIPVMADPRVPDQAVEETPGDRETAAIPAMADLQVPAAEDQATEEVTEVPGTEESGPGAPVSEPTTHGTLSLQIPAKQFNSFRPKIAQTTNQNSASCG